MITIDTVLNSKIVPNDRLLFHYEKRELHDSS